jgi:geranylgeranyl diphosphate synthase type II
MYDALNCAAALEMIHAYSLIHDDLPAMDDAKLRRGRPANHLEFGEAHAILAGDGLLTLAFEILVSGYPEQGGNLCGELARGAGWQGMVAGQAADMEEEGNPPTAEVVEYIHRRKTGALITTSLRAGGIVGEANQDQLRGLTVFGDEVGLAFQIIDDILDETVESSRSGKSAGGDRDADKMTYTAVYGVERSRAMAIELTDAGVDALASLPRPDLLVALARRIVRRVF